jgi:hypothetical protein
MWVARYLFVGCVAAFVLAAMQIWAMGETIEKAELRLMPMTALPVKFAELQTPSDRLANVIDELRREYGKEMTWALLMREAARVKHEG